MGLWMLSFGDRGAAIVEAESMSHARLRVAVKGLIRASLFIGGYQIDPEFIPLIPGETIGRKLSRGDANELLKLLKHAPARRQAMGPSPRIGPRECSGHDSCDPLSILAVTAALTDDDLGARLQQVIARSAAR